MTKVKSGGINGLRGTNEIRDIKVELDFTPNALSSVLYSQGKT
ncbi:MAG: ribonuclease PH, partial [Candidatus Thalassarchaeaceae archaeon]